MSDNLLDLMQDAVISSPRKVKGERTVQTDKKAEAYVEANHTTMHEKDAAVFTRADIMRAFIAGYDRATHDATVLLVDLEADR